MKFIKEYMLIPMMLVGVLTLQFCNPETRQQQEMTSEKPTEQMQEIDRATKPAPGLAPEIKLPKSEKFTLENGLDVVLVTQSEVPMLIMDMVVNTGSAADPVDEPGLADFTAALLDEGTEDRTSLEIAEDIDFLGARLNTGSNWDYSYVKLTTLTKHLDSALNVYSDMILNATFPEDEFERVQQERLNSLLQKKDRPSRIATDAFYKVIYTKSHPYGTPDEGTEESIKNFTAADLQEFKEKYYVPNNSTLFVVGDITVEQLRPKLENAFGDWQSNEEEFPVAPDIPKTEYSNIYLVDKAGAPQSQIRIGHPGLHRNNPDYAAVQVMNEILGGSFSGRINMNLREDKGYTYGARSLFVYRQGVGPFIAYAGVKTSTTDSSVIEFMKEFHGIVEEQVTDEELENAKSSMTLSLARETETLNQILDQEIEQVVYNLPEGHVNEYVKNVRNVTKNDVQRVAKEYLHLDNMAIVIVGDVETIKPGLEAIGYGDIIELDASGNPVK